MRIIAVILALALWIVGHFTAAPVIDLGAVCIPQACAIGAAAGMVALAFAVRAAIRSNRPAPRPAPRWGVAS